MEVGCITTFSAGRGARETLLLLLLLRPDVSLNWLLSEGHAGRCKSCKGPAQEQGRDRSVTPLQSTGQHPAWPEHTPFLLTLQEPLTSLIHPPP